MMHERKMTPMKKYLFAAVMLLSLLLCLPASADANDCWYYAQNGRHDFEQTNFYYATCEQDGYYILECRQCGLNQKEISMPATGHDWQDDGLIKQPACTQKGTMQICCSVCGETGTKSVAKTGHAYGSWEILLEAGDASKGTRMKTCSLCGDQVMEEFYPDDALYRGSLDSDGIMELQMMLVDCGYLNDSIDGVFGKKTEAAVKAFQQAAGLYPDGVAWPQTIQLLEAEWERLQIPTNDYTVFPSYCYIWQNEDETTLYVHCQKHWELYESAMNMLFENEAESMIYSYLTCQAEIESMYDEWISLMPVEAQGPVAASKALCISFIESQRKAMRESYNAMNLGVMPSDMEYGMELWMRSHTAWLCQMLEMIGGGE